jgi:O-glycosyl hydrolase
VIGVDVWGVTVQNEPEAAQPWESCIYTPETTRDFVAEFLGPQLKRDHPEVKIFAFDHNKVKKLPISMYIVGYFSVCLSLCLLL